MQNANPQVGCQSNGIIVLKIALRRMPSFQGGDHCPGLVRIKDVNVEYVGIMKEQRSSGTTGTPS